MKKVVINEKQKKSLKKAIAAQDQVGGKVNAGIMDAVCGVGMCEEKQLNEWTDLTMELWEDDDCTHYSLLNEFLSDKQKGITKKQWNLIPKEQYWNLLKRYMFSPEMARIPRNIVFNWFRNIICKNTMQISYITDFAGHSQYFPDEDCYEVFGQEFNDYHDWSGYLERIGFYAWCVLPDGSDAWSDYGLQPLYKLIETYNENMSGEDILILINRCLDIGHQRGDLASAFIEGGSRTCSEISSWKCLEEGKNVPEKCDKCGGKIVLQIHGEPVYVCKECGKYFGTMPFNLEENMEDKQEYELGIKKNGNSLPPDIHVMNEGKETKFNYEPYMKSLADFMVDYGLKILPYPDVTLINHNDNGVFVPTGNYSPDEKRIRVYTIGRHPKDVLRTFAHEMIHHMQNLRGDTNWGHGGDLEEDSILEQIEGEAYLLGNLVFRKWTEHIQHRTGGATILKEGVETELDELTSDEVDLSSFQVKDQLNPYFWKDGHLDSRVRMKLLDVADDFIETLGIDSDETEDVVMTGSLANYNWSEEYSDIDLHVIVDYGMFAGNPEMIKDYFDAKRKLWNELHKDLRMYGFPVELYVQDKSEVHASTGVYSVDRDKWLVEPRKETLNMDDVNGDFVKDVVAQITQQIDSLYDLLNDSDDEYKDRKVGELAKELFDIIRLERRNSLKNSNKEMVDGNIIFKTLRRNGYIEKLVNLINDVYDKTNSL